MWGGEGMVEGRRESLSVTSDEGARCRVDGVSLSESRKDVKDPEHGRGVESERGGVSSALCFSFPPLTSSPSRGLVECEREEGRYQQVRGEGGWGDGVATKGAGGWLPRERGGDQERRSGRLPLVVLDVCRCRWPRDGLPHILRSCLVIVRE